MHPALNCSECGTDVGDAVGFVLAPHPINRYRQIHRPVCRECLITLWRKAHPRKPLPVHRWWACRNCRRKLLSWVTSAEGDIRYCSNECRAERKRAAARVEPPGARPCERCREGFTPKRSDARYCSTRCRVAAHRAA